MSVVNRRSGDNTDKGYAWVLLFFAVVQHVLANCPMACLGVFLVEIKEHFKCSQKEISMFAMVSYVTGMSLAYPLGRLAKSVGTMTLSIYSTVLVFSGYLLTYFVPEFWMLFISYGIITSIAHIGQYVALTVAVNTWFSRRRGLAIGVTMSAAGIGGFLWPLLATKLIQMYCWKGAFLIIGAIQLNAIITGLFLRPMRKSEVTRLDLTDLNKMYQIPKKQENKVCDSMHQEEYHELNTDSCEDIEKSSKHFFPFCLFLISCSLTLSGFFLYMSYLPSRLVGAGMDKTKMSLLFSLIGLSGIFLRPIVGLVGDFPKFSRILMYGLSGALGGLLNVLSVSFESSSLLAVYAIGCGITAAGYQSVLTALPVDLLGRRYNEIGTGSLITAMGVSQAVLHPTVGWLVDTYADISLAFFIFGICQLVGGILAVITWFFHKRNIKNLKTIDAVQNIQ